jgi:hypothetical protein
MEEYVERGSRKMADTVDRGEALIRSEAEWRRRYSRSRTRAALVFMVPTIFFPFILMAIYAYWEGDQRLAITMFLIFPVAMVLGEIISHWVLKRRPAVGIYEKGIQHYFGVFIPWSEIATADVQRRGLLRRRVLRIEPLFPSREIVSSFWNLPLKFYGEEGLTAIKEGLVNA